MIETDEQRRWWFATHPEYSGRRTGQRSKNRGDVDKKPDKSRPIEVDKYVDEKLKYEKDPTTRELLKQTKFWFGTEFASKTPEERHVLLASEEPRPEDEDEQKKGSFGRAYDWGKENSDEALRAVLDYLRGIGPAILRPVQAKYPSADDMAKRLKTTRNDFHTRIKEEIKTDFRTELKKIGNPKNLDIGVDRKGNIVLKNRETGREIGTGVPLNAYSK